MVGRKEKAELRHLLKKIASDLISTKLCGSKVYRTHRLVVTFRTLLIKNNRNGMKFTSGPFKSETSGRKFKVCSHFDETSFPFFVGTCSHAFSHN